MADNKLQSLTEIFNEKFFRIPDFQRGYSWETNQLEDFWEDLINLKGDKIHYTGLLTVEPISKSSVEKIEKCPFDDQREHIHFVEKVEFKLKNLCRLYEIDEITSG